jgi:hypothetical protein
MKASRNVTVMVGMALLFGCSNGGLGGKYTARSYLRVRAQESFIATQPERAYSEKECQVYRETQRQLVKGRFVLLAALRKPDVAKLPSVQAAERDGDVVHWLEGMIKVDFPGDAEIMSVSVTRSDPREAAILTNAIVDAYLSDVVDAERNQKRVRLAELDRAFIEMETDIRAKREDLKSLQEKSGLWNGETLVLNQKLVLEEWSEYQKDLRQIRTELRGLRKDLALQKALSTDAKETDRVAMQKTIKQIETAIAATEEQEVWTNEKTARIRKDADRLSSSSVDADIMRNNIKNLEDVLAGIAKERELVKIELRAAHRVTALGRADVPEVPD